LAYFGAGSTRIEFGLNWDLTCTAGAGNCNGALLVQAPQGATFLQQNGKNLRPNKPTVVRVSCAGPCARTTTGHDTLQYVAFVKQRDKHGHLHTVPAPEFLPEGRKNKTFAIKLVPICYDQNGTAHFRRPVTLKLKFNKYGNFDFTNSDLNGDGRPDGGKLP
jgi:hypothetical protein